MSLVLDSSVTLAWIYGDEISAPVQNVLNIVTRSNAWVPTIWPLEIANSLQTAVRHRRIDRALRDGALADLKYLDIKIDSETNEHAWSTTLSLAERLKLTLYDAAYLELASRKKLPLASLDKDLRTAAKTLRLPLLGM